MSTAEETSTSSSRARQTAATSPLGVTGGRSSYRPAQRREVNTLTRFTLRTLARRAIALEAEVDEIDKLLKVLTAETRGS
jgi:hypothetical protein